MKSFLYFLFFLNISIYLAQNKNEIRNGIEMADPFILLDGDTYYLYGTQHNDGIICYSSKDLRKWKNEGLALNKKDVWGNKWYWAPEVYKISDKKYIMYFSANERINAAISNNPKGPFKQTKKQPMLGEGEPGNIDNHLFIDDDGKGYIFYVHFDNGNVIYMAELENDFVTVKKNTRKFLFRAEQKWEIINTNPPIAEGPFVIKHNGIYYLTYSANHYDKAYAVGFATSTNVQGPYKKYDKNPFLNDLKGLKCPGHHAIFRDKEGKYQLVFHTLKYPENKIPRFTYIIDVNFVKEGNTYVLKVGNNLISPVVEKK